MDREDRRAVTRLVVVMTAITILGLWVAATAGAAVLLFRILAWW